MGRNARWLNHTVHLCYSPALTGEMSSPFVDVGRLNASQKPAALLPREKIVCFMLVFWYFRHYTVCKNSSLPRAQRTKRVKKQMRRATVELTSLIRNHYVVPLFGAHVYQEESSMLSSTDQREPLQQGSTAAMSAWARRLLFLRIILITVLLIGILFWLSSKIITVLLILLVAALLAYAVVPVIDRLPWCWCTWSRS